MRIRLAGLVLGAFGTFAGACVETPQTYNAISFCTDKAQAMCQVASTCSFDPNVCQTYQYKQCTTDGVNATHAYRRLYNADNARFCISAVQAAYRNGVTNISAAQLASINDTCERVYQGMGVVGDSCENDYDCGSGLICASKTPDGTPMVCEPAQPVEQGQACDRLGAQCASDTYCAQQSSGTWACSPCPGEGQQCAAGQYCMSTQHCVQGTTCEPRGGQGDPCVNNNDCGSGSPYCDHYSNTCAPGLTFQSGNVDCRGVADIGMPPGPPEAGAGGDGQSEGEAGSGP
jgi:hypothetical protein